MKIRYWLLLAIALGSTPSWAGLGESVRPVSSFGLAETNPVHVKDFDSYTVRETEYSDHSKMREYILRSGIVFGIAWEKRRTLPDFSKILGAHFTEFSNAVASRQEHKSSLLRSLSVNKDNLVVISGGRPRNFIGHAFLRKLLPTNLSEGAIQ